jgi:hypothetical protein
MTSTIDYPGQTEESGENSFRAHMFYPTPYTQTGSASLFIGQNEEPEEKYTIPAIDSEDLYRDPSEQPEEKPAISSMVSEHSLRLSSQHGSELPVMAARDVFEDATDEEQKYQPSPSPMPVVEDTIPVRSASAPIFQPHSSAPAVSRKRRHSVGSSSHPRVKRIRKRF